MHLGPVWQGRQNTRLGQKAWKIDVSRRITEDQANFGLVKTGVMVHVPQK
jgi:hypothetical protein